MHAMVLMNCLPMSVTYAELIGMYGHYNSLFLLGSWFDWDYVDCRYVRRDN